MGDLTRPNPRIYQGEGLSHTQLFFRRKGGDGERGGTLHASSPRIAAKFIAVCKHR